MHTCTFKKNANREIRAQKIQLTFNKNVSESQIKVHL